jgi:hypothetical protein
VGTPTTPAPPTETASARTHSDRAAATGARAFALRSGVKVADTSTAEPALCSPFPDIILVTNTMELTAVGAFQVTKSSQGKKTTAKFVLVGFVLPDGTAHVLHGDRTQFRYTPRANPQASLSSIPRVCKHLLYVQAHLLSLHNIVSWFDAARGEDNMRLTQRTLYRTLSAAGQAAALRHGRNAADGGERVGGALVMALGGVWKYWQHAVVDGPLAEVVSDPESFRNIAKRFSGSSRAGVLAQVATTMGLSV